MSLSELAASATALPAVALGELRDVSAGDRTFPARCAGHGPDSVMLVSGQATPMSTWEDIQSRLGAVARVCAYDRPGVGLNLTRPPLQTFEDMASDLDHVMAALGLRRPVIVVGHSLGGAIAMTWAAQHPGAVRGVVLVDASSTAYVAELLRQEAGAPQPLSRAQMRRALTRGVHDLSVNPEHVDNPRAWTSLDALPRLGGVPLVVLTHDGIDPTFFPAQLDQNRLEAAWVAGQRRWLARSDRAQLVRAEGAGHQIPFDRPDLVIAGVLDVLRQ